MTQRRVMGFRRFLFNSPNNMNRDIAIIGIGCRFPGADNYSEFWTNLQNGINSIQEISQDRWDVNAYFSSNRTDPNKSYSKWAGLMRQVDKFDAMFFKTTPHEAARLDPQQRILLEETWHCIEDSGVSLKELQQGNTSVHIGLTRHDYIHQFFDHQFDNDGYAILAYCAGIIANRISYFLNLTGESQLIDGACASSLVCIHNGIQLLLNGESEYALAGAASVICHPWIGISCSKAGMLSPDGQCKTFDAGANGYVPGEGVGVLLLETYENAIKKGHHIYGVIKGCAVHHTGQSKSLTAPKIEAQRRVIQEAIANAKVAPEHITYLEAHGTGTSLGDPIEIEALTQAFSTSQKQYCAIGSVKSNIGHLESAAGMAGIIKVLMMLKHQKIVKTLNVKTPNPIIDFAHSPFKLAENYQEWHLPKHVNKRIAGVSSFGFGGVNAHLIVEEYQNPTEVEQSFSSIPYPFILSAKSEKSLQLLLKKWQNYSQSQDFNNQTLRSICDTLLYGREQFNYRFAITVQSKRELMQILRSLSVEKLCFAETNTNNQKNLILRIKNTSELQLSTLSQISRHYPPFQQAYDDFKSTLLTMRDGKKLLRHLKESKEFKYVILRRFLSTYLPVKALLSTMPQPHYLLGNGIGELVSLVVSDLINLKDLIQWLTANLTTLPVKRPKIALYDKQLEKIILPLKVTTEYCKKLMDGFAIEAHIVNDIIQKSNLLYQNQHTFKKTLHDYLPIFKRYGIELKENVIQTDNIDNKTRYVLTVLLTLATRILLTKWNLPEKINLGNAQAHEFLNLLTAGLITPEDFALLVLEESEEHYEQTAAKIQQALVSPERGKDCNILQQFNRQLNEVQDYTAWLEQLINADSTCDDSLEDLSNSYFIDIGGNQNETTSRQPFLNIEDLSNHLPSFLAEHWQNGIEVNWEAWYPKTAESKACALPTYPFLEERHWLDLSSSSGHVSQYTSLSTVSATQPLPETEKLDIYPLQTEEKQENLSKPNENSTDNDLQKKAELFLRELAADITKIPKDIIQSHSSFADFGIDSLMIMRFNEELGKFFPNLSKTILYEHSNLESLARYLVKNYQENFLPTNQVNHVESIEPPQAETVSIPNTTAIKLNGQEGIAIIGFSGRFPQAEHLPQYWENLKLGQNCITDVPANRWPIDDYTEQISDKLNVTPGKIYCNRGGFIKDATCFDAEFFNISPKDATYMDPQERIFLESVYACIEAAGYTPDTLLQQPIPEPYSPRVGVFAGISFNLYPLIYKEGQYDKTGYAPVVNTQTFSTANRISYFFNFTGPSFTVDTACSSSLYALHLACESIRRGECTVAIAGGSNLTLHPAKYATLCATGFMATDGLCHAFSDGGDGYVPGEGVGALLLKPLSLAIQDNDHIYGVIRGSAVSQDGKTMGYTVPNPKAQSEAISLALKQAAINPRTISYVEAHGTGTVLGDAVEIQGLQEVYKQASPDCGYCAIGSVKSNIGHLEAAAGISQCIKVLLQMSNKTLVPSLIHGKGLNPNIDFKNSPFVVQQTTAVWETPDNTPRRAAISSFGAGGSNVHLIMEEYKDVMPAERDMQEVLIAISAKSETQLHETVSTLHEFLQRYAKANPITGQAITLTDLAYTLQVGRVAFKRRLAFTAQSVTEVITLLGEFLANKPFFQRTQNDKINEVKTRWLQGEQVEWETLWENENPKRIYLPTYNFQKKSCGISLANQVPVAEKQPDSTLKLPEAENPFLTMLADLPVKEQLSQIMNWCQKKIGDVLGYEPPNLPNLDMGFFEMGMESLQSVKLKIDAENAFEIKLPDSAIFDYPTIRLIAPFILQLIPWEKFNKPLSKSTASNYELKPASDAQNESNYEVREDLGTASNQEPFTTEIDAMNEAELINSLESLLSEIKLGEAG